MEKYSPSQAKDSGDPVTGLVSTIAVGMVEFQVSGRYRDALNCQKRSGYNHRKGKPVWNGCPAGGSGGSSKVSMGVVTLFKSKTEGQPTKVLFNI